MHIGRPILVYDHIRAPRGVIVDCHVRPDAQDRFTLWSIGDSHAVVHAQTGGGRPELTGLLRVALLDLFLV